MSTYHDKLNQASVLFNQGHREQARAACQKLIQSAPKDPAAPHLMSLFLLWMGQPVPALHYAAVAAQLDPSRQDFTLHWANLLQITGKSEKSLEVLRRDPRRANDPACLSLQCSALLELNRCCEALAAATRAYETSGFAPDRVSQVAAGLLNIGRPEEAFKLLGKTASDDAGQDGTLSGLALLSNYVPGLSRDEQAQLHRRYGRSLDRSNPTPTRAFANSKDPSRQLRIGILSPDLRVHSVAAFIEPLFAHHDRAAMNMVVYQTNALTDPVTLRLKGHIKEWHVMDNISDAALAERIVADRIDILIELSGHTHAHSLACLHARAAPVQITYLGYPNITGLSQIDYRIVDTHTDPSDLDASRSPEEGERFARLDPVFLCYQPPADAPPPSPPPCTATDQITFGSFNNAQKLNDAVINLWSRLLNAVPNSRLLLKGVAFTEQALRDQVAERFAAAGLDKSRIEILPRAASAKEHLALYSRIDIALDPVPYNGTTTTCEALWMGVPVITLAGDTHAGRVGVSLLNAIKAPELIAEDEADYIRIASNFSADRSRAAALRGALRGRMTASPLCDGPAYAKRMHDLLRSIWRNWCATTATP